jgi:hypothetical protein
MGMKRAGDFLSAITDEREEYENEKKKKRKSIVELM